MAQSLTQIAQSLKDTNKKVQLIYAFNGTGKTRLSQEFKGLIAPKKQDPEEEDAKIKLLYYNAFTEDLFYWDNDLDNDVDRKLKIQPNTYTYWILKDQGQEPNIAAHFQRYTSNKLTPSFNDSFSEVRFSFERGDDSSSEFVKISKGEESCFIWSVFYSLLKQTIDVLNVVEEADRETDQFNDLQYIFIDDPVSSLDDTHLIELAVNIAELIKSSQSDLKFIITTHNPLFYNVLFNEFNNADSSSGYRARQSKKWRFEKLNDGSFSLIEQSNDSPFSYHLFLLSEIEKALESGDIRKYHFSFLRNILEKASTFLGHANWKDLLPNEVEGSREGYYNRIINLSSHSKFSGEEISLIQDSEKSMLDHLVNQVKTMYGFKSKVNPNVIEEDATV